MAATGLTYLQIVNSVLVRLREAQVAAVSSTTLSALIGSLVNEIKDEVEDAARWYALRNTWTVTTASGTTSYSLTSSGMNAVIINGWNTVTGQELTRISNRRMDELFFGVGSSGSVATGQPETYAENGFDSNYDLKVDIWPQPTAVGMLKFNLYQPQPALTTDSTVPLAPQHVIIAGAIARALRERGGEDAQTSQAQEQVYMSLLSSAVSRELERDTEEMDWDFE